MIQMIRLNPSMSWLLIPIDGSHRQSVLCSYDIDNGEIHLVCYFLTLKRIVCIVQSLLSLLLQTGISFLMHFSIYCCTNIDLTRYHFVSTQAPVIAMANSTLINGLGRYAGGPKSPLAVINVSPKKRYRFRLISISCDPNFTFSIDGHNMVNCLI